MGMKERIGESLPREMLARSLLVWEMNSNLKYSHYQNVSPLLHIRDVNYYTTS